MNNLYKEFDEQIGLSKSHETLQVNDEVNHRNHPNHEVVIHKVIITLLVIIRMTMPMS
ncbi:hypothetical protein [Terrilactibacillus tamarindi]|uniref:hypothetical protein n=1 Tax=Terrilactibacillus tamarindi TaxID=2599694 RepID=UPI0018AD173B|nr:hypothetical protein [Terrilactibacillus tamarindi]